MSLNQQSADPADVLLEALLSRLAAKAAGSTPNAIPAHGPGGALGQLGLPANIINAMVLPLQGLAARMPIKLSQFTDPIITILTGQTASTGEEPTTACGDGRQPGNLKFCSQAWPFGRIVMDSQVVQADRAGELINRGEFIDQSLIGDPFAEMTKPIGVSTRDALRSTTKKKILELVTALHRDYGHLLYQGNPGNTAGSAGYIEFFGLDTLINNNYQDVFSKQSCAAANSLVRAFNANVETDAANTVAEFTELVRAQKYLAERLHLGPVKWVFAMRYSLFMKLTELWPCTYLTYRCQVSGNDSAQVIVTGTEQNEMRNAMRSGRYLLIDDEPIEVIIDDFIEESVGAGTFTSDVYFVPLTINGGYPVLYWEYFNLAGPYGMQEAVNDFAPGQFKVLGGGRYWLHHKPPTNECIQIRMGYRPRVVLEAPFLAARLTGVTYTARIHERSGDPNDPYYFVNGGSTAMPEPYFYPPVSA